MISNLKMKIRKWNRARINASRNIMLNLIILFFDTNRKKINNSGDNQSIFVLRSDGKIGDTVISTGFFKELRRLNPKSPIYVYGNNHVKSILEPLSVIDEVIVYKKGLLATLKLYFRFRKENFKIIMNTTDELKPPAAFLMGQLKSSEKLIFKNLKLKSVTKIIDYEEGEGHFSDLYLNTLKYLFGNGNYDIKYLLNIKKEVVQKVRNLLVSQISSSKRIIVFNAFAGPKL